MEGGFITQEQLEAAGEACKTGSTGLLDTLVSHGMLSQETLVTVLSFQLRIPVVDLRHVQVDTDAVALVPEEYARRHGVMATGFDSDGSLRIATHMPNDFQLSSELSSITGRQTKFVLAIGGKLEELINRVYTSSPVTAQSTPPVNNLGIDTIGSFQPPPAGGDAPSLGQDLSQLSAMQAVDMVTLQAVKRRPIATPV